MDNANNSVCQLPKPDQVSIEMSLAWQNLHYSVNEWPFERKTILRNVSGFFELGNLNGLMGPSGAGKTTLLNCLSGTPKMHLSESTAVYLNCSCQEKGPVSYFIEQHVHQSIIGQLTVRQILLYAFKFKNGNSHSSSDIELYMLQILSQLLLDESILNRPFERCSGGEQKRIAIAQELMAIEKPAFLFVDEPTTGLDSAAAYEVMLCLQKLVKAYRITVIASVHAPNDETLNLFDKLYVMAKGGVAIYSGPPNGIQDELDKVGYQMNSEQPPIEALIKIACNGLGNPVVNQLATLTHQTQDEIISQHLPSLSKLPSSGLPSTRKCFTFFDFALHCARQARTTFLANFRSLLVINLLICTFFCMMVTLFIPSMSTASSCYSKSNSSNSSKSTCQGTIQENILTRENINYLTYVILFVGLLITCISAVFHSSFVKVFRSEHRNFWYSLSVFFWSSLLISLIEMTLYAFLSASLGFFLSSQHAIDGYSVNWSRFALYALFIWLLVLYMQSLGQLIGLLFVDHLDFAIIACLVQNATMMLMNGFMVDIARNENPLIVQVTNIFANKYISFGMIYTLYGFERCYWETEYSFILQFFNMDSSGKAIPRWIQGILVNVLVIRGFTLLLMYIKFGTFTNSASFVQLFKKWSNGSSVGTSKIDHFESSVALDGLDSNNNQVEKVVIGEITRKKSVDERKFEHFSKGRILFGWRNLSLFGTSTCYEIGSNSEARKSPILRNLNGEFKFGTLNALMGTSGAGKTSLLKVLNGRCKTRLDEKSEFYFSKYTKITTCFLTQEVSDHLMPGLTAKQMLTYASRLKNRLEKVDHEGIALKWLQELDLLNTTNTKVEKCSGGERKRLTVALELTALAMPNCVCVDEPTSGLDSNSAEIVISTLRHLTQNHPLTIIASIHQPTTEVLIMFDQLYVLARGGVCIYSGPPSQIKTNLSQIAQLTQSDSKYAIEALIKESCRTYPDPIVTQLVDQNDRQFANSPLHSDTQLVLDGVPRNRQRFSFTSTYLLFLRYLAYFRGHLWLESLFFSANFFFYGMIIRFFYSEKMVYVDGCIDISEDDTSGYCRRTPESTGELYQLINNFKYCFFYHSFFLFFIMFQCEMSFLKELRFFKNEHRNGWYSSGSFYLMKSFFEILPLFPIILVYVYIGNWYEPIHSGIYWHFVFLLLLGAIGYQGLGHTLALLSRGNITILIVLSSVVHLFLCLLSNFFLTYTRLHYVYKVLSNVAITRFLFEAVMLLVYGFGRCPTNERAQLLYAMNIEDTDYEHCIVMLLFNILFYRIIAMYLLIGEASPVDNRRQRGQRIVAYMKLSPAEGTIPGISSSSQLFTLKVANV